MPSAPGTTTKGGLGLQTVNLMADLRPQPSLSEGLVQGIKKAHRSIVHGGPEFRNSRRSNYAQKNNYILR